MNECAFINGHPLQHFTGEDFQTDYTERDNYFIRCLQSMEQLIDIDAYILDYQKKKFIYFTQNCTFRRFVEKGTGTPDFSFYDQVISKNDLPMLQAVNRESFNFYYDVIPVERRYNGSYTLDIRIKDGKGGYLLLNNKISVLDMTPDGRIRLGLCILTSPTGKRPGKAYFKMTDTGTVYEYIENTGKFVEVNSQRLTPKSEAVLELAGEGKTEAEISQLLHISVNTVKYHKRMIFKQLNVRNITEAVNWKNSQKTILRE
ncbi:MAG: helix-turn-helix transcriptional regulator [Tannerellaceae bacterium]|nr:helix-turn-helix transcriptional regulator [Tannerellaceae bacterium]